MDSTIPAPRLSLKGLKSALAGPFDLAVEQGGCVGITGPSGSGKSLFLRMICDLDANNGEVWLDGRPRAGMAFDSPQAHRTSAFRQWVNARPAQRATSALNSALSFLI
jgi:ABC-type iron transport system FetAB ATPase subunit